MNYHRSLIRHYKFDILPTHLANGRSYVQIIFQVLRHAHLFIFLVY